MASRAIDDSDSPWKVLNYRSQEGRLEVDSNPMAAVILAQLKALETKESPTDRRVWKYRLIKGLYERGLRAEQIQQLFRLVDWMMTLPAELEEAFRNDVFDLEEERKMPYVTSIERLAVEKGQESRRRPAPLTPLIRAVDIPSPRC